MNVLVVGGAGYIGAHMILTLLEAGHDVVTYDSLVSGHRAAVLGGAFVKADLANAAALAAVLHAHRVDAVMHFASCSQVGESVADPGKYYRNNVCNTVYLLDAMVRAGVRRFVFSSTAAIFGEPAYVPIDETHPRAPVNAYGASKLMVERMLHDYERAHAVRSICLRYFNAAGADPKGRIGERHEPETHLIPLLLQVAAGRRPHVSIFGRDYDTPDGTCIRDYVHVLDLCHAHLLALEWLRAGRPSAAFNLGNGTGHSVLSVIRAVERMTGQTLPVLDAARRVGDPARLVAHSRLAQHELGWRPQRTDIDTIVHDAWNFERLGPKCPA